MTTVVPSKFRVVATTEVVQLDDFNDIERRATDAFMAGKRGMCEWEHNSGKILSVAEHTDDGWVLTLCRPHER